MHINDTIFTIGDPEQTATPYDGRLVNNQVLTDTSNTSRKTKFEIFVVICKWNNNAAYPSCGNGIRYLAPFLVVLPQHQQFRIVYRS